MPKGLKLGGRKKGTPNKLPVQLKEMILKSLAMVGGETYLAQRAVDTPGPYLALVGKVLPLQVKAGGDDPVVPTVVKHVYETVKGD